MPESSWLQKILSRLKKKEMPEVYAMTSGGPGEDTALIAYRITTEAFTNLNVGYAATLAVMLFMVMALFSFINMRFISKISD